MTRQYRLLVDWDGDGFWNRGVSASDPLNLIPDPVLMRAFAIRQQDALGGDVYEELFLAPIYQETDCGLLIQRVEQEAGVLRQLIVGRNRGFYGLGGGSGEATLPVTPGVEHVVSAYVRLLTSSGSTNITLAIYEQGDSLLDFAYFPMTLLGWERIELAFTPSPGVTEIWIGIWSDDDAIDVSFDATGFMLNVGATAPVFNAGHATNTYDDVSTYVRDTLLFNDGLRYDSEFADPAELTVILNNADGFWNPNNEDSPVHSAFRRGLGVKVEAQVGNLLADNDMDAVGTAAWTAQNDAALSKVSGSAHSVPYVLKIEAGATENPNAMQSILTVGQWYTAVGFGRSVGAMPWVYAGENVWLGIDATLWQFFSTSFIAQSTDLQLVAQTTTPGEYAEFDDAAIYPGRTDDSGRIPLWRGTLASLTLSGEDGYDPQVVLQAEDPMRLLTQTEYAPPYQENARVDEALVRPFDDGAIVYPAPGQFGIWDVSSWDTNWAWSENRLTAFDESVTTLPYAGDNLDPGRGVNLQQYLRQILVCEGGGRLFWDAPTGRLVFHNRQRDASGNAVEWTPGVPLDTPLTTSWGDDIINHVELKYETRAVGTPGEAVWEYSNLPLAISAESDRRLFARFADAGTNAQIAVKNGIAPVATTDYVVNYTDGGMESAEAAISIFVEWKANTAEIRLRNQTTRPIAFTTLQLRGTPVTTQPGQIVISRDAASIAANGLHKLSLDIPSINTETFAQQIADTRAHERSNPIKFARQVSYRADQSNLSEALVLSARVGEFMTLDTGDGDQRVLILSRRHLINMAGVPEIHTVQYGIKPAARSNVLIWDSPLRGIWDAFVWGL